MCVGLSRAKIGMLIFGEKDIGNTVFPPSAGGRILEEFDLGLFSTGRTMRIT